MRINFRPSEFVFSDGLKSFSRLRLTAGWADGKDFVAGLGNQDFVFPLGGEGAVFGDHCPTIVQDAQMAFALVDHRLDGENHARFQNEAPRLFGRSGLLAALRGSRGRCRVRRIPVLRSSRHFSATCWQA